MTATVVQSDCLDYLRTMPSDSVDLVMCSPPYADARTYSVGFNLKGQEWVDWACERFHECLRVCKGLVCWVVEGRTRKFRYTAEPALMMADLHRAGVHLRKPPIYQRVGIPGSGGPDFWRNDWEWCICASKGGKLPWSDNTASGKKPIYSVGGACSNRTVDGRRINKRTGERLNDGRYNTKLQTRRKPNGERARDGMYAHPPIANPGNVIRCKVGGGMMGSDLAHETEAPYCEAIVEPFVRCFCPPSGIVLDPFCGSGTTLAVALKCNREAIGIDVRQSQCDLTRRRLAEIQPELFP